MRPADKTKLFIKNASINSNPEVNEAVLKELLNELDKSKNMTCAARQPDIWRTIMKSPLTKIAAAAAIIIALLIGLHYFGDSINITSTAYAEIIEKLHNARTMTYTSNGTTEIEIAFKKPGYMRTTMPGDYVTVIDWTQGKGISTLPTRNQYIEMEMSNLPHDPAQQQFNVIEKLRTLPDRADEELGTREIDGRVLQGFRVTEEDVTNTVWIDSQNRELVRVETEFINAPGMNVVMTDFQFDVDLEIGHNHVHAGSIYKLGLHTNNGRIRSYRAGPDRISASVVELD